MRKLQTDERVGLNDILVLSEMQAKTRYGIGRNKLLKIADHTGAVIRISERKKGYSREVLDDYFRSLAE